MGAQFRDLAGGWLPSFRVLPALKSDWEASGRTDPHLEKVLDAAVNNMEEELHASVEGRAVPILAALRSGNSAILQDNQSAFDFSLFIAMQYMRTPRMMQRAIGAVAVPGFNVA